MSKLKIFENLAKIEDFSNLGKFGRFLKREKSKKSENLVKINESFRNLIKLEDYSNFGHQRYLKIR